MTEESETKLPVLLQRYAGPFRLSRAFPYLWGGESAAYLGSSVMTVVLPAVVYSISGSTTTMGLIQALNMLMYVAMLPLSGGLVDRYERLALMMLADGTRFLTVGLGALLILTGHLSLPVLGILIGINGAMNGLFQPAYSATRAVVFVPEIRNQANALTQISDQAVRLIGPSLGGLLITFLSAGWGFGFNALTFLFSFVCISRLKRFFTATPLKKEPDFTRFRWREDFMQGVAILRKDQWLWITILTFGVLNIFYSGITAVLAPWLFNVHYHFPPYAYGIAVTSSGLGAILAGVLFGSRKSWRKRGLIAYGGMLLSGLALLLIAFIPSVYGLAFLFAIQGFGYMIFGLIWETSLQEMVPPESFGRVASLDMLGSFALLPLGYLLVGWLADVIGGISAMIIFSLVGIAVVAFVLCLPGIRRFD